MWNNKSAEHDAAVEAVVAGTNLLLGRIPSRTMVSEFITEHWAKLKMKCQTESDVTIAEALLQIVELEGKREWLFVDQKGDHPKKWRPKARGKGGQRPGGQGHNKGGKGDQSYSPGDLANFALEEKRFRKEKAESKGSNKGGKGGQGHSAGDEERVNSAIDRALEPSRCTKEGGKEGETTNPSGGSLGESKGGPAARGGRKRCKWHEQMAVQGLLDLPSVTEAEWWEASGGLAFVQPETFAAYMNRGQYKAAEEKKAALLPPGWESALKRSEHSDKELVGFIHKHGVPINIFAKDPMLNDIYSKDAIMVTVSKEKPEVPRLRKGATAAWRHGVTLEEVMKIIQEGKTEVMAEAKAFCLKASDRNAMVVNQEIANMRMANEREGNIVKQEFNDLCSRVRDIKDQTEEHKKEVGHLLPFMLAAKGGQQNDVQEPSVSLEKVNMLIEEGMAKVRAQLKEDSVAYVTQEEAAAAFDKKLEDKFDEIKRWLMQNMGNQISTGASSASVARHHAPGGGARSTEQAALEEEKPRAKAAKTEEVEDKSL